MYETNYFLDNTNPYLTVQSVVLDEGYVVVYFSYGKYSNYFYTDKIIF